MDVGSCMLRIFALLLLPVPKITPWHLEFGFTFLHRYMFAQSRVECVQVQEDKHVSVTKNFYLIEMGLCTRGWVAGSLFIRVIHLIARLGQGSNVSNRSSRVFGNISLKRIGTDDLEKRGLEDDLIIIN